MVILSNTGLCFDYDLSEVRFSIPGRLPNTHGESNRNHKKEWRLRCTVITCGLAEEVSNQRSKSVEDDWNVHFLHNGCRKYKENISPSG